MGNDQMQDQNQNLVRKNERNGRGLFYGVIAVATFIIMAVGATFAYFTATTGSGESAVQTGSTTLRLKYISYGSGWMNSDLIPAESTVVEYSFENQNDTTLVDEEVLNNIMCKDDFGNSICSVYVFQVYNGANSPQSVSIDVMTGVNEFENLYTMAYELAIPTDAEQLAIYQSDENNNGLYDPLFRTGTEEEGTDTSTLISVFDGDGNLLDRGDDFSSNQYSPVFVNRNGVVKTLLKYNDTETSKKPSDVRLKSSSDSDWNSHIADDITIPGGEAKTFALVLYVKETGDDQTLADAAKQFTGQVIVGSGDGSTGVTGTISASIGKESELQSNNQG